MNVCIHERQIFSFLLGKNLWVGLLDHFLSVVKLYKKLSNCLLKWLYLFADHQQSRSIPVAPHSFKHLVLSDIFLLVCLVSKKWYTIGDLIYISLIYNDVKHVLICLLACICTHTHTHTLLGRVQIICLFRGCLFFPLLICKDSVCILI